MRFFWIILLDLLILLPLFSACKSLSEHHASCSTDIDYVADRVIDDKKVKGHFTRLASEYYSANGGVADSVYHQQLNGKRCKVNIESAKTGPLESVALYQKAKQGVLVFGTMYKCGKCPNDHILPASAFLISKDGVCVSNYHVFQALNEEHSKNYITAFVMDHEGRVFPITEVLAASKDDDLSIFRINTLGQALKPLSLGSDLLPASEIHLISHPDSRFYSYTNGFVGRKFIKHGTRQVRQAISAEFARGSSGAPVLDNNGNVVGVVEATLNIDYRPGVPSYQMSIRTIIPVSRIFELIDNKSQSQ